MYKEKKNFECCVILTKNGRAAVADNQSIYESLALTKSILSTTYNTRQSRK